MDNIQVPVSFPLSVSKPIVLVGMMGCGKSAIGGLLAKILDIPFVDSDSCIENRMHMSIAEMFERYGEAYFRSKEYDVIHELITGEKKVIAVGGGAFIQPMVRACIKKYALSIWIRAEFSVLLERVSRKNNRPLLEKGDKAAILKALMDERYSVYAEADMVVDTTDGPHEVVLKRILEAINKAVS